jgi:hypothetical protein
LNSQSVKCVKSGSQASDYIAGHADHTYSIRPACEIGGSALCAEPATCTIDGHDGYLYNVYRDAHPDPLDWQACLTEQEARRLGGLTPGMVRRAFQRLAWPASPLVVQPPRGRTLVNFDTNFYTEQPAFDRTVRLLGRQVELHIWPSQFRWVFGDGAELPSTSAGAPYPDLLITHSYLQKGGVSPRVDTTYAASFRVDGGAWRDVDGTVTIPGEPVPLEVVTARPVLVGEN